MMNREESVSMMAYPSHYPLTNNCPDSENRCRVQIPPQDLSAYGMTAISPTNSDCDGKGKKKDGLRKGKWTAEEEKYTNKVIEVFNAGLLKLGDHEKGITLRAYLADKLECDPMRITKKYTGASCLGKRVYHYDPANVNAAEAEKARVELEELEKAFHEKLEQMNRKRFCDVGISIENSKMISTPAIDALLQSNKVMQNTNVASGAHLRAPNTAIPMPMMMKSMYPGMMPHPHHQMYPHPAYMAYPAHMYPNDPNYMRSSSSDSYYGNFPYYIPPPPAAMMHHMFPVPGAYAIPVLPVDASNTVSSSGAASSPTSLDDELPHVFDDEELIADEVIVPPTQPLNTNLVVPKVDEVSAKSPKAIVVSSPVKVAPVETNVVTVKEETASSSPIREQSSEMKEPVKTEMIVPVPPKVTGKHSFPNAEEDAGLMMPPTKKPRAMSYENMAAYIPTVSSSSMLSMDQNIDTHSLIGFYTQMHKMSSKEDLADFFFENSSSTSVLSPPPMPNKKSSPMTMLHKSASNKLLSKVDSVESLCKLISPQFCSTNI